MLLNFIQDKECWGDFGELVYFLYPSYGIFQLL